MPLPSDPDCYWVAPGRLVAGEYPGAFDDVEETCRKLGGLLECGVRTFVDLTQDGELDPYEDRLREEADRRGVAVTYHRHEVEDLNVPSPHGMRAILDLIAESSAEAPVYVHCWGGIGRTGTVVCCWLVEQGMTGEEALAEIARLRAHTRKRFRPSPEMPGQASFVRNWTPSAARDGR